MKRTSTVFTDRLRLLYLLTSAPLVFVACWSSIEATTPATVAIHRSDGVLDAQTIALWRSAQTGEKMGAPSDSELLTIALTVELAGRSLDRGAHLEEPLSTQLAQRRDSLLSRALLEDTMTAVEITDEEVEEVYRRDPKVLDRPPKWRIRNLFIRFSPDSGATDRERVLERVEQLSREVSSGASFAEIAKRESDSQSRFRGGLIGNVTPGDLDPSIERLIRDLAPGEISEPLVTPDGVTIFYCDDRWDAVHYGPDEVRARIRSRLEAAARRRARKELDSRLLADAEDSVSLDALRGREARARGLDRDPTLRSQIEWQRLELLALAELTRLVRAEFEPPTEDEVRSYFETHRERFRVPRSFRLSAITIPVDDRDPRSAYRRAIELRRQLLEGTDFSELALVESHHASAEDGGDMGWVAGPKLASLGTNLWKAADALAPGELSAPVEQDGSLWILWLRDETPRREATFAEAATRARKRLSDDRLSSLRQAIEADLAEELDLR